MKKAIILLVIIALPIILLGTTYTVKQDGTGDFITIQDAIDYVVDDDEIIVWPNDPDPYYENIDFNGKNIVVGSLFYTTQNPSYIQQTIIDGSEEGSVVTFNNGENSTAVLSGFTIQNGLGEDYPYHTGGGIHLQNFSSPTLQNLIITNNSSGFAGGGIYCFQSNPSISDATITDNTTQQYGAGICAEFDSNITVKNVTITNNETLETWPFTTGVYIYGNSMGSYIQYDPESERNVGAGGGVCLSYSEAEFDNVVIDLNVSTEGAGLWSQCSYATFSECEITNNSSEGSPFANVGGVMCFWGSEFYIENSIIENNSAYSCVGGLICWQYSSITLESVEICGNTASVEGGGIYVSTDSQAELINVLISDNVLTGGGYGGGIYYNGSGMYGTGNLSLDNVTIINNSAAYGGGLYCYLNGVSLNNVIISRNDAQKGSGIYCLTSNPDVNNSTITLNTSIISGGGIYCKDNSNPELVNTILWDNLPQEVYFSIDGMPNSITIAYSDIEDGQGGIVTNNNGNIFWGNGNIDDDPLFNDTGNDDYTLKWTETEKSPCIDTGDPDPQYNDPDGTRADMGALYHPHDEKTYVFEGPAGPHDGLTWLCFDILDIYYASTNNQVQNLLDPIKLDLYEGMHEDIVFSYNPISQQWQNGNELIISPKGYKIEMVTENSIDVSGFRCKETTTFDLTGDDYENWIGYFVGKTQHVYDAFDGYLDNINYIQHQEWSIDSSHGWPDVPYTLSPGDMVVVECDQDIVNFCWVRESETERFIVQEPQNFSYTEEADYIPIYMSLDPEDLPTEIGAIINGECKGATVVQDTSAQICAYIMECQGGSLEFEFYYGSRSENKIIREYNVYDHETGYRETTTIDLKYKQDYYYVSFRSPSSNGSDDLPVKLSASNYPNPFNPTTTISYDLPSDGNIELSIYNIRGQHVKILIMGEQIAGSYEVVWNGKDNNEKSVSSGIYFYKLSTKDETIMKKILMLK
jgi:hypothetical protein